MLSALGKEDDWTYWEGFSLRKDEHRRPYLRLWVYDGEALPGIPFSLLYQYVHLRTARRMAQYWDGGTMTILGSDGEPRAWADAVAETAAAFFQQSAEARAAELALWLLRGKEDEEAEC